MAHTGTPANDLEARWRLAAAGDLRLQAQLAAAIAADQRALVFAGFLVAASAALGGASATVLTGSGVNHYLGKIALIAAGGMMVAMACALMAARPVHWFFAGAQPRDWRTDLASKKPEIIQIEELLLDLDCRLSKNDKAMKTSSRWIVASAVISIATLALSGLAFAMFVWR